MKEKKGLKVSERGGGGGIKNRMNALGRSEKGRQREERGKGKC